MATIINSAKKANFSAYTESRTVLGTFPTLALAQERIEEFYNDTNSTEKCYIFGVTFDTLDYSA